MVSWQVWRCCREKSPEWEKEDNENRQKGLEQNEETEKLNGGDNGLDGEQSGGNEAINNQNSKSDFQKTLDPVRSTFESEKLLNQILDRRISAFVPTDDFYDDLPEDKSSDLTEISEFDKDDHFDHRNEREDSKTDINQLIDDLNADRNADLNSKNYPQLSDAQLSTIPASTVSNLGFAVSSLTIDPMKSVFVQIPVANPDGTKRTIKYEVTSENAEYSAFKDL